MVELLVPESPMIHSGFPSPDLRRSESSSSRYSPPRFLANPSPSTLAPILQEAQAEIKSSKGKGNDLRTRVILRHALRWAVDRMDLDLMAWLVGLDGYSAVLLDEEAQGIEDDDGWGLLGMAIQNSCGRQEQEESARLLVGRWGIDIGLRKGTDRSGWTPLHLAALISTPPLISFLLNRGASPHALTNRGLTPLDLVSGIPERSDIAVFLEHSSATATPALGPSPSLGGEADGTSLSGRRQAMLRRRRAKAAAKLHKQDQDERGWHAEREKEAWVREMAAIVEVSPELLLPDPHQSNSMRSRSSHDSGIVGDWRDDIDADDEECEAEEEESMDALGAADRNDSMLVFSLTSLPALLDILVGGYRTVCAPLDKRTLPANALYLHARFALFRCDDSWLEELLEGAVERIEQGVYGNVEDLAYLAFWAYNTTTLLHLLRSDPDVGPACEELNLLGMMEELINAIHVFIIRVAEQRIDGIFDAALLDYETLEDFDDVRFEGEWTLFRSFGGKKRRELLPKASQIFSTGSPNPGASIEASPSGLLGALRDNVAAASPLKTLASRASIQDLRGHASRSTSMDSLATVSGGGANGVGGTDRLSPVHVTDILSSVLMVLQLYEVNPAITIQAFSQVFFWIACEMFNRILTRKKYLCRSKAVQIRMNITVLEDWIRANGLPTQTGTKYLEPVNQLLRWLQCLSQVRDFDTVIGTMQTLKNLNPLQMRKAVRDYRYEVNEGRMTEECAQYLAQLQRDWEKRRVQLVERQHQRAATDEGSVDNEIEDSTSVDALFDGTTSLADFIPQSAPECYGELLDSRFMLPFLLPENVEFLVATPPTDAAFANANISAPFSDAGRMSRSGSRSSFASTRPMGWALPESRKLRRLPRDFFTWLKDKEAERRHQRGSGRPKAAMGPAIDPPLGPSSRLPVRPPLSTHLSSVHEDQDPTPIGSSISHPFKLGAGMPSPSPSLRTSDSLNQLREQAKIPFEPMPVHRREDSYELKQRSTGSRSDRTESQVGPVTPMRVPHSAPIVSSPMSSFSTTASPLSPRSGQYELGRMQRAGGPLSPSEWNARSPSKEYGESGGEGGEGPRKKWWKIGRTASSSSSVGSEGDRKRREASEDTVVRA